MGETAAGDWTRQVTWCYLCRFALLQQCLKVFEEAMADVEYVRFLPTDHPDYIKVGT